MFISLCFIFFMLNLKSFIIASNDIGYEALFYSYDTNFDVICYKLANDLLLNDGIWLIPSVSKFEMNDINFTSVLDGYGKFHKFEFNMINNEVCYSSKMIETGFYNLSISSDAIAPSVLFMDTFPPLNYTAFQIITGPNDNVYVNTNNVGKKFVSLTDSQYMIEFDIDTLSVADDIRWQDKLDYGKLSTGSAHTFKKDDCMIGIDPQSNMDLTDTIIYLYELCPTKDKSYHRNVLNSYNNSYIPYMHSFGLTKNYAVLPHQSFYFDYSKVMNGL